MRQRLAARAAFVERGIDGEAAALELAGDGLAHVARAHDADGFDLHDVFSAMHCLPKDGAEFTPPAARHGGAAGGWFTMRLMQTPLSRHTAPNAT